MTKFRWLTTGFMVGALLSVVSIVRAQQVNQSADSNAAVEQFQPGTDVPALDGQQPAQQERSLMRTQQAQVNQAAAAEGAERGELGVWLVGLEGRPGVEIRRITSGSAAEQAGLESGDIILQVNGEWATSPQAIAEMVRQIPIGKALEMQIWRDGQPQKVAATVQARRQEIVQQSYEVGFGEEGGTVSQGDIGSRTTRLEKQLQAVVQELKQLRQDFSQLHSGGGVGINEGLTAPAADASLPPNPPAAVTPTAPSADATAPAPGFEPPQTDLGEPAATPPAAPAAEENNPFGSEQPKTEEKEKANTAESDSLFN